MDAKCSTHRNTPNIGLEENHGKVISQPLVIENCQANCKGAKAAQGAEMHGMCGTQPLKARLMRRVHFEERRDTMRV